MIKKEESNIVLSLLYPLCMAFNRKAIPKYIDMET